MDEIDEKFINDISSFAGDIAVAVFDLLHPANKLSDLDDLYSRDNRPRVKSQWESLASQFLNIIVTYD